MSRRGDSHRRSRAGAAERAGVDIDGASARSGAAGVIHQQPALNDAGAAAVGIRGGDSQRAAAVFDESEEAGAAAPALEPLITPLNVPSIEAVPLSTFTVRDAVPPLRSIAFWKSSVWVDSVVPNCSTPVTKPVVPPQRSCDPEPPRLTTRSAKNAAKPAWVPRLTWSAPVPTPLVKLRSPKARTPMLLALVAVKTMVFVLPPSMPPGIEN